MGALDGIWSGVASGVGGIVSSIFGNKAQRDANRANFELAQMNNQWSEKMMDKQAAYNLAQWEREKAFALDQRDYDSAKNQAARLREAGLNPPLVMGGNNAGSAASTPSGSSVGMPSPSSATMQPLNYTGFANAIQNSIMMMMNMQKNQAETDFIRTQSDVMKAEAQAKLAKFAQETRGLRWNNDYNEAMEGIKSATENEQYLGAVVNRLIGQEQLDIAKQTRALNDIQITHLPDQMKADIALKLATAEYQGTTELSKDLKFFEKKFGQKISKSDLKIIFDAWKQNLETQQYRGLNPFNTLIGVLNRD